MKTIAFLFLSVIALVAKSQSDSVFVIEDKDDMTDKVYYYASDPLICINPEDKKQGFSISFFINKNKKGILEVTQLKVKTVGIGSCNEKDEVIFLLEDDTKLKAKMFNDFNCEGKVWCNVSDVDKEMLAQKKVNKVRVQNGRSYESYTHTLTEDQKDYFIQLFYAVKNNKIKPPPKDK